MRQLFQITISVTSYEVPLHPQKINVQISLCADVLMNKIYWQID
jgi:hypothetical protein